MMLQVHRVTMPERTPPMKAITVLSLLVVALVPASVIATVQSQLAWYHGFGLFYGALGSAEIGYLMCLLASCRAQRPTIFGSLP